jgi:hypothetical protein
LPFVPLEEEASASVSVTFCTGLFFISPIWMLCYEDGLGAGKGLLALKTADASNEEYSPWFICARAWNKHKQFPGFYPPLLTLC